MQLHSNRERPFHLGTLALEKLPRIKQLPDLSELPAQPTDVNLAATDSVAAVIPEYLTVYMRLLAGAPARAQAPVPADPQLRADNLKAAAYFLDAVIAGTCALDAGSAANHSHALVIAVEFGREPGLGDPGQSWIAGANAARTDLRAGEIAAVLAGYLRWLGFSAQGHVGVAAGVDIVQLAVKAGVVRVAAGQLQAPFLTRGFRLAVVTTDYSLAVDAPLAPTGALEPHDTETQMGQGGTRPYSHDQQLAQRPLHLGRWPMELIKRVEKPTTLVLEDQIARVSKRGDFFKRAQAVDMGEKSQVQLKRFAFKYPLAMAMTPLIGSLVPLQGPRTPLQPSGIGGDLTDLQHNANAIKALGHFLGADFVGVCEAKPWMYYSHDEVEGQPIEAYHKFAVVMLIDQGFETMDGASGDDWISATTSMRAYLRGAEIAGVMAAHCRRMGYSSRAQSNAHSEIIHNPAILMAGLGEVSRIGETILNPFIGPRSKSVVFTTDFPMTVDLPIDFGLQDFCAGCRKCARECPCDAIPKGSKIMFNGYEIWKADVEKCTKYRVNNPRGSACGRCMKMCPWNREDTAENELVTWRAITDPTARAEITAQDDIAEHGKRNPVKKWWFDLEIVDGVCVAPVAGVNQRDLDLTADISGDKQKFAMYPPHLQPPGGSKMAEVFPLDRSNAVAAYAAAPKLPD